MKKLLAKILNIKENDIFSYVFIQKIDGEELQEPHYRVITNDKRLYVAVTDLFDTLAELINEKNEKDIS